MKIDKKNPHHWLLLLQQGAYTLVALLFRPFTRKPMKPVVVLYGHQFAGNLKALYTAWSKSHVDDLDVFFLSLDPDHARQLRVAGIRVLQCNRLMDMLALSRAAALISDHGLHLMTPLLRLTDIRFIDVWHGIPFKGFTPRDFRLQHRYHEVWVSSPLLKTLYQDKFGFPADIVHSLGYARTDKLFLRQAPDTDFRQLAAIPETQRIVLYAPTWQQDHSGREMFPFGTNHGAFVHRLGEICGKHGALLVIRSHLNAAVSGRTDDNIRYCSMSDFPDTESLLQHTDILLCDWSSIAFDFLALDRPVIFLDVEPPFRNGFSLGREYRYGKVATDMDMLCSTLDSTLASPECYASEQGHVHREIQSAVYGENTDGKSAARQLTRLIGITTRNHD